MKMAAPIHVHAKRNKMNTIIRSTTQRCCFRNFQNGNCCILDIGSKREKTRGTIYYDMTHMTRAMVLKRGAPRLSVMSV
jgi:hypothetical protein